MLHKDGILRERARLRENIVIRKLSPLLSLFGEFCGFLVPSTRIMRSRGTTYIVPVVVCRDCLYYMVPRVSDNFNLLFAASTQ